MSSFEEKKFCQITTLMHRWDCGRTMIYDLVSENVLKAWHPKGTAGSKGMRIEVASVIRAEKGGYIKIEEG